MFVTNVSEYITEHYTCTFSSLDAIGPAIKAHPYLICGTVVLCVLIGGTLYYFDRKHKRQMEMMEMMIRTGNFTVILVNECRF